LKNACFEFIYFTVLLLYTLTDSINQRNRREKVEG